MTPSHHKGKEIDRSTPWTPYQWDERGFYFSSRLNSSGVVEYRHPVPGEQTTSEQQSITPKNQYWASSLVADSSALATGPFMPSSPPTESSYTLVGQNSVNNFNRPQQNQYFPASSSARGSTVNTQGTVTFPGAAIHPGVNIQGGIAYSSPLVPSGSFARSFNVPGDSNMSGAINPNAWSSANPSALSNASYYPQSSMALGLCAASTNPAWTAMPPPNTSLGKIGQQPPRMDVSELAQRFQGLNMIPKNGLLDPETSLYLSQIKNIRREPDSDYAEELDPRYQAVAQNDWRTFWILGRVFMMLWTEETRGLGAPTNSLAPVNRSQYGTVWLNGKVYTEIRRFVVIRVGYGNTLCSPIHSYNGQGTLRPGLAEVRQHCIIHTSDDCPPPLCELGTDGRIIRQEQLSKDPIKVRREQLAQEGDLGDSSRLNYSKISTVDMYVRVLNIGVVERDSKATLERNSYLRPASSLQPPQKGSRGHRNVQSIAGPPKEPGEIGSSAKKDSRKADKKSYSSHRDDDKKSHSSHKDNDTKSHDRHKDKKSGYKGH